MFFDKTTSSDPRSFMYYQGEYYINGTEIILTDEYINAHSFNGKKIWKYARFDHQTSFNGFVAYFFCASRLNWLTFNEMGLDQKTRRDYAPYFIIESTKLENVVGEIVRPIQLIKEENEALQKGILDMVEHPKTDKDYPGLIILWIVYIIAMIASLIFKQFYLLWIIETLVFFALRKDILKR